MGSLGDLVIFAGFLVLCLVLAPLIKTLRRLWWTPRRIQRLMRSQGIKGPSYTFMYGSTKQISRMKKEAMATPMGLSHAIFAKCQPHIEHWLRTYGKNYLQWYGTKAQMVVTEPGLVRELLNIKDGSVSKIDNEGFVKKLLGDGLVSTKGEKWAKLRKLANYAFHGENLKGMVPSMISGVEMMLERWKTYEGREVEVYEEFRLLTSEVISRTAFGSNYLKGKDMFEMLMRLAWLTTRNMFKVRLPVISKFFKTNEEVESDELERKIRGCILEIINEREDKVKKGEEDSFGNDFLGLLLKAHHDANESQRISVDDLVDECKTFFFAGQETTNNLLGWTVLLLAIHTDWQEAVRKEVLSLIGHENPNPDSIAKLKTMGMVLNESLRLYPPVMSFERKVEREVKVGKLKLPANLNLLFSTLALHHDPQIWGEDVNEFKPKRFSEGVNEAAKNNPAAFFPFGMGLRSCIGSNFTFTEAKIALSMILQRYSFTLSPSYVHMPLQILTLHPQHGIQVMLQPL